jgi:hypothetical protein
MYILRGEKASAYPPSFCEFRGGWIGKGMSGAGGAFLRRRRGHRSGFLWFESVEESWIDPSGI